MASGLTSTAGLNVPSGLSVSPGFAAPGGGLSFAGFGSAAIQTGVGEAQWNGYAPGVLNVTHLIYPGYGAATWGGYAPLAFVNGGVVSVHTTPGAATWTGYAPYITPLVSPNAVNWGSNSTDYLSWGLANELTWGA